VLVVLSIVVYWSRRSDAVLFDGYATGMGGIPVQPGQSAVFSVPLISDAARPMTLVAVRLVPVPGFPNPKLVHVALLGRSGMGPSGTTGWPPVAPGGAYPLRCLAGTRVDPVVPSRYSSPPIVLYGVTGAVVKEVYAVAGIQVEYRIGTSTFAEPVYTGGMACVVRFASPSGPSLAQEDWCEGRYALIEKASSRLPGVDHVH
jgi:hypothetical protein